MRAFSHVHFLSQFLQRGVDQQQTGFTFRLHREIPALPQSYPSVNLGGSSQAKKCLEFAIPGLRASSCLGFFFFSFLPLGLVFTALVFVVWAQVQERNTDPAT